MGLDIVQNKNGETTRVGATYFSSSAVDEPGGGRQEKSTLYLNI